MINLARRDIAHNFGRFAFTGVGLGLLIGVTLTMAGVYRGMVDDAKVLQRAIQADVWVVQQHTLGPFAAPCSRMAILTGMAAGGLVSSTIRALVGVAIGVFVFHVQLAQVSWPVFAAVFLVTMLALYALGMLLSSLFVLYGREAWHLCNALGEPVQFVSGLYFPVRTFGEVGAALAGIIPLTLGVDALRQVLLGPAARGLLPLSTEIALLAGGTVLLLWLAARALEHLERLSKQEGRLTQRWQ